METGMMGIGTGGWQHNDIHAIPSFDGRSSKLRLDDMLWDANVEFDAGSASIMLPDEKGHLRIIASYGVDPDIIKYTCIDGSCSRGYGSVSPCVYKTGRARLVETEPGIVPVIYKSNSMCVPIYREGEVIGVFNFSNRKKGDFSEDDLLSAIKFVGRISGDIAHYHKKQEGDRIRLPI